MSSVKPKNGVTDRMILADFGYPWLLAAMWSQCNEQWVAATSLIQECEGKHDPYFENEWFDDEELKSWQEMPKIGELLTNH